jgi:hypothetical protein
MWSYQMAGLNLRGVSMQDAEHMGQLSSSHAHLLSKKVKAAAMACCAETLQLLLLLLPLPLLLLCVAEIPC